MVRQTAIVIAFAAVLAGAKQKEAPPSELDRFVSQATAGQASPGAQSPGSRCIPPVRRHAGSRFGYSRAARE